MSAIFGLVNLDNEPVSRENLERMNAALAAHGADGNSIWQQGAVGLGQRLMCFTPEDRWERQPVVSADGNCVLVSDGRIDNRPELMASLDITPALGRELPDSALVLRAYEKWREDCPHHLVGAFAFAVRDAYAQQLVVARAAVGGPSLFYHANAQTVAFATMPKGLFALPSITRALDEQYLADYLTLSQMQADATFYRGIKRLPPGNLLIIRRGAVRVKQYWQPDLKRELYLPHDEDYVQAFDELFERVVRDQLRSETPVGVMMSGGFDSTSIAATAARVLKPQGKRLVTFTEVPRAGFDGELSQARYADETPFVQAMARRYDNLDVNFVRTDGRVYLDALDAFFDAAEIPFRNASNRVWFEEILRRAQQQGVRVLLTGEQGNLTISWGGANLLPQLVRRIKWKRAWHEARVLAHQANAPSPLRLLVGQGIMPLMPAPLLFALARMRRRDDATKASGPSWQTYSAIHPDFAAAQQVEERARAMKHEYLSQGMFDSRRLRYEVIRGASAAGDGIRAGYQAMFGIDLRDSTSDRRVVEFCLALPEEQYIREGQSRWLIRRAMANRLPPEILENKKRGLQAADWFERLSGARARILDELTRLEQVEPARRALDLPRLRQLAERMDAPDGDAEKQRLDYRMVLEFGLMTGRFLQWFEGGT